MTIKQQQCLLTYLGYNPGPIDGVSGPKTIAAMECFKSDYGVGTEGLVGAVAGTLAKKRKPPDCSEIPNSSANIPNELNRVSNETNGKTGTFWDSIRYFKRSEFACHCGGRYCNGFPVEPDEKLVTLLDGLRAHYGKPVTVSSGIRCTKHNAAVGGVSNSQHLYGTAADIIVSGVSPSAVADYAETLLPGTGGIGRYNGFTHIDVRGVKSRWRG